MDSLWVRFTCTSHGPRRRAYYGKLKRQNIGSYRRPGTLATVAPEDLRAIFPIRKEEKYMLSLPKILAPVDFSERSPGAARYAGKMACHFHSELTLLHVLDASAYEMGAYEFTGPLVSAFPAERRTEAESLLANFLPDEFRNMNVRRIVLSGDPAGEIVEFAHSERASL